MAVIPDGPGGRAHATAPPDRWATMRWHLLAALLYLAVALWALRVVLPAPSELLPTQIWAEPRLAQLAHYDESMVLSVVVRNADTLLRAPSEMLGTGQCFPLRRSHTLGEHMFGEGVLAALPYLLSREPIWTYNTLLLLSIWIAGLGMYAFVFDLVRRPGPALVAGLIFAVTPDRVSDLIHPYVHADHFAPLAALCLRRLFVDGRVFAALGTAVFCSLLLLESFYAVVASGVVLAVYSGHLAWAYRDRLLRRLPLFLCVLVALAAVAFFVFEPYLETQAVLGVLAGRGARLRRWWRLPLTQLAVVLAAVAMVDRLRGPRSRDGDDPRWAFVAAALLCSWFGIPAIRLLGASLASPVVLLGDLVPGFDAVRAPGAMGYGAWFAVAVLAGYGTLVLTERLPARARAAVVALLLAGVLVERNVPTLSKALLGQDLRLTAWNARPSADELRLLRATRGPILYLPIATGGAKGLVSADYLRLTSFATRPTSACYNSFGSPFVGDLAALGGALPDPAAADALHALGFRTVVVDRPAFWPAALARFEARLARRRGARLVPVGDTERFSVFHLRGRPTVRRKLAVLAVRQGGASGVQTTRLASGARQTLEMWIVNRTADPFVHPAPLAPTELLLRWRSEAGAVAEQRLRAMLPLALLPGEERPIALEVDVPAAPGRYRVTLSPASAPRLVLVAREVEVRPRVRAAARAADPPRAVVDSSSPRRAWAGWGSTAAWQRRSDGSG